MKSVHAVHICLLTFSSVALFSQSTDLTPFERTDNDFFDLRLAI